MYLFSYTTFCTIIKHFTKNYEIHFFHMDHIEHFFFYIIFSFHYLLYDRKAHHKKLKSFLPYGPNYLEGNVRLYNSFGLRTYTYSFKSFGPYGTIVSFHCFLLTLPYIMSWRTQKYERFSYPQFQYSTISWKLQYFNTYIVSHFVPLCCCILHMQFLNNQGLHVGFKRVKYHYCL